MSKALPKGQYTDLVRFFYSPVTCIPQVAVSHYGELPLPALLAVLCLLLAPLVLLCHCLRELWRLWRQSKNKR